MKSFFETPLILDGATGTELRRLGMRLGDCTERWVLENLDALVSLQRGYIDAGSHALYAPTFGLNRVSLRTHGLNPDLTDWASRLVALSRKAAVSAGKEVLVGGDIAPTGMLLEPLGDLHFDDFVEIFSEQVQALETAGVDFYAIETQMYLPETRAAVTAVRSISSKPILVSFSVTATGSSIYGDDLTTALRELEPMGIDAFGVNCLGDLQLLCELMARLDTEIPLLAKPNAGHPDASGQYDMAPETLASYIPALYDAGVRYFGGCCGTNAEHIAAIHDALG